jgi:hypothetical protein
MKDAAWKRLLDQIRDGFVVPIVGCRLLVDAQGKSGLQAQVARKVLAANGLEVEADALPPFRELNEAVTRLRRNNPEKWQDYYGDVDDALREVAGADDFIVPAPIRDLAEIDGFRLLVTLTPDDLLARSLRKSRQVNEIVHAPKQTTGWGKDLPSDWIERRDQVQLLYLLGKSSSTPVFAIHDEDVLEYAHNVISRGSHVPNAFIGELQQRNLLLIGCNFPDWLSRFFLRATRQNRLDLQGDRRREWLVEPPKPEESLIRFLQSYSKDTQVLSDSEPVDFVTELHQRWMAAYRAQSGPPIAPTPGSTPGQAKFFISYSRETDLKRAEALFKALIDLGASKEEIWFDGLSIDPGEDLDTRIKRVIDRCRHFLPLLSHAADQREEGYVFKEWNWANARWEMVNREDFIVPIVVDADCNPELYKARQVLKGKWTDVLFGHAPEGVPDHQLSGKLKDLVSQMRSGSDRGQ